MFFSAVIGRNRVAADRRPSPAAAWSLVVLDIVVVTTLLALLFDPIMTLIYAGQPSDQASGFFLFVLYVIFPAGVLINACRWAARSRRRY
ncbi:hypothetical protein SAMN04488515_3357 [Cognatiyoonia koreensis]|uniref:Uncharacterized protein n=1 Tax=Cognatiyoonia koreensis TaxID=364200 RepID=A0A1I0RXM5_9RHOB|nr:hypothetical protein [Cognatiyoonia koreensis]SEW45597.1 hypothetical protein SAMN04488515_3357 [Cognatiyoonia koreensis]